MAAALGVVLGLVAFGAWIVAATSAVQMLRHRKPGISGWWFATNGLAFFTGRNFEPAADPARRRLMLSAGIFFLAIVAGSLVGVLASAR